MMKRICDICGEEIKDCDAKFHLSITLDYKQDSEIVPIEEVDLPDCCYNCISKIKRVIDSK